MNTNSLNLHISLLERDPPSCVCVCACACVPLYSALVYKYTSKLFKSGKTVKLNKQCNTIAVLCELTAAEPCVGGNASTMTILLISYLKAGCFTLQDVYI